tara:strand:+ start:644 stop:2572 length:1929 start_codon:yes stop_codon:yes gene_type:complete
MSYSFIDYGLGDGVDLTSDQQAGNFNNITLGYLNTSDIYIIRTTSQGVKTTLNSNQYTITVEGSVTNVKIHTPTNGLDNPITIDETDLIRIGRTTDVTDLTRTFTDGSVLKADDLNAGNYQLLYALQEDIDVGLGALPIDTDGKYNAGGRVIKNLGEGSNASDNVTRSYVDDLTLYGAAVATPQSWTFATNSSDVDGDDRKFTLEEPASTHTTEELYIVELDGVIQVPSTYTVTEFDGTYTLTLTGAATVPNGLALSVRNIGVGRHHIHQPFKAETGSDDSVKIQRVGGQTGNLLHAYDEHAPANTLAKIDADGDATFTDVNATGNASVSGNASVGGTAGITGDFAINTNKVTVEASTGNTEIAGTLNIAGATTMAGGLSGNLNLLDGVLQLAGGPIKTIRQITTTQFDDTADDSGATMHYSDSLADAQRVYGMYTEITPQLSSSTIILLATPRVVLAADEDLDGSGKGVDDIHAQFRLCLNNTARAGEAVDVGMLGGSLYQVRHSQTNKVVGDSFTFTEGSHLSGTGDTATSVNATKKVTDSEYDLQHSFAYGVAVAPTDVGGSGSNFDAEYSRIIEGHFHELDGPEGVLRWYGRLTMLYVYNNSDSSTKRFDVVSQVRENSQVTPHLTDGYSQFIAIEIG